MDFIEKNQHKIASVGVDPITALYTDWMDDWSDKLGGEIAGGDWRKVKPPWKKALRTLMRAPFHCFFAAHLKDIKFGTDEDLRFTGEKSKTKEKPKLRPRPMEAAAVEKTVPYTVDITLRADNEKDHRDRPTYTHTVTFWKGRIPLQMVGELYIGRTWSFDARKRPNPWKETLEPLLDKWSMGAVDHLGIKDPEHFEAIREEVLSTGSTFTLGEIVKLLDACPSKTLTEYDEWWRTNIAPSITTLDKTAFAVYKKAHEAKKASFAKEKT
jgi:hypothetical protein